MDTTEYTVESLATKTYDVDGNLITEWDEDLGWFENGVEQNEYGQWIMTRIYHLYTEEQLADIQMYKERAALIESRRQLSLEEVAALFIRNQINVVEVSDQTSLRMMDYYPTFSDIVGQTVKMGYKFTHENRLYKTIQPDLTIQEHWVPGVGTESLYSRIDLEHTGAIYDPIPYEGNMELFAGRYYTQDDAIYLCTRDTGVPVYHKLADLIGLYVEKV